MTKFFNKFIKPYFWPIFLHLPNFGGKKMVFFQKIRLSRTTSNGILVTYQNLVGGPKTNLIQKQNLNLAFSTKMWPTFANARLWNKRGRSLCQARSLLLYSTYFLRIESSAIHKFLTKTFCSNKIDMLFIEP